MLTGRVMYSGETVSEVLAAVIMTPPAIPASLPTQIDALLRRCLERDPMRRLRDIGEARIVLSGSVADAPAPVAAPARGGVPAWVAVLPLVAALALGGLLWRATRPKPLAPLVRLDVQLAATPLASQSNGSRYAISPDGSRIVAALGDKDGRVRLFTRLLQQAQLVPVPGTEDAGTPFFSPDGQWLGFAAGGKLKKVSVDGGAALTLCDAPALRGASWGDDGNIVYSPSIAAPLMRIPSAGGVPAAVTKLNGNERTHRWPDVLPGSRTILFTSHVGAALYDDANIEALSLETGQRKIVVRGGFNAHYAVTPDGSGRVLYAHQGTMFAVPFDAASLEVRGPAVPVLEQVQAGGSAGGNFSISRSGTAVYISGQDNNGLARMFWFDESGIKQPLHDARGAYYKPRFSPDGKRLVFTAANAQTFDLWVKDLERGIVSRLTFLPGSANSPVWSPNGKYILFRSSGHAKAGLYWIRADGGGEPQQLSNSDADPVPYSFSPDGKRLAFSQRNARGDLDLFTARLEGDPAKPQLGARELFLATPGDDILAAFSPDGRWLAYMSNEAGSPEIYVRPFPGPGGKWQVSTAGGTYPSWSRDGRELFYRGGDQKLTAVAYAVKGDSFLSGKVRTASPVLLPIFGTLSSFEVAPDGKRGVAVLTGSEDGQPENAKVVFLLNFGDELQRRTAGGK